MEGATLTLGSMADLGELIKGHDRKARGTRHIRLLCQPKLSILTSLAMRDLN